MMPDAAMQRYQDAGDLRCPGEVAGSDWQPGPFTSMLSNDGVHVWRIALNAATENDFDDALTRDELAQAGRFHFEADRRRFRAARAALRVILGRYLAGQPANFKFARTAFGKPYLLESQNPIGLRFNLSHSHELALLAVTLGREVGIDVERVDRNFASREVAERFFSRNEIGQLESLTPALRTAAFFTCWTRKEAYIKARGEGLSLPLDEFDLSLTPDAAPLMLANRRDPAEVSRWSFRDILAGPGYAGALVIEGGAGQLQLYNFLSRH